MAPIVKSTSRPKWWVCFFFQNRWCSYTCKDVEIFVSNYSTVLYIKRRRLNWVFHLYERNTSNTSPSQISEQIHRCPWFSMGYRKRAQSLAQLLAQLVAHRVFAFWVGNCQKLELAPFETCCPTSRQSIANPVAHRSPLRLCMRGEQLASAVAI